MSAPELHPLDFVNGREKLVNAEALAPHGFVNPEALAPRGENSINAADIAPWEEPPATPTKPHRSFGFGHKPSFTTFGITRQSSAQNIPERIVGNDSQVSLDRTTTYSAESDSRTRDLHKSKSSMNILSKIKRSRSKPRLSGEASSASLLIPPVPSSSSSLSLSPPQTTPKRNKKSHHKPGTRLSISQSSPDSPSGDPDMKLDTNLDDMEGIVDITILHPDSASIAGSGISSGSSVSGHSSHARHGPSSSEAIFSNPYPFGQNFDLVPSRRPPHAPVIERNVSPKSQPGPSSIHPGHDPVSWDAPDSWAVVDKNGSQDPLGEPVYSSSDEDHAAGSSPYPSSNGASKRRSHRKTTTMTLKRKEAPHINRSYKIRVYRPNQTHHIVTIDLSVTVAELYGLLNKKLLLDGEHETHRLYLKERGRERVLAQTERPADIVRRRLEQAGYDAKDGQDLLENEDIVFLLKFMYKSTLLGPAEEELVFDNFEYIDLTGRSLKTVPIVLYSHAECIVSLTLSRNPMLEIPRDFIQRCMTLRDLRLSNMAMKTVPRSVRFCTTLHRLDISSNRIVNLDESFLSEIPHLRDLKAQNNRLESLPWFFPRMNSLKYINISNNKFQKFPSFLCQVASLVDLDISFNMITEIPEEIGELKNLEQLVIVGNQVSRLPQSFVQLDNLKLLDCRRNRISDLSIVVSLPKLETLMTDHNSIHALELSLSPSLVTLDASRNDITQLTLVSGPKGPAPYALTSLDISYAKLPSLDEAIFWQLTSLKSLKLSHNSFRFIPESLGELAGLEYLYCSDNQLDALPSSIGQLQKLETLDAHNNSLTELPVTLWNCASLVYINFTSNLVSVWHYPPMMVIPAPVANGPPPGNSLSSDRKGSTASLEQSLPPLAKSLERLYLGENRLGDDALHPLTILRELKVLNLSFNDIQEMPSRFFMNLMKLEELYLSGNKLSIIPTDDLHRLPKLTILFLNGNRLQTLPQELTKVTSLQALDVGSNVLKYNITNWEFDWNWNFNTNLRYLNLSGNKRLVIKSDSHMSHKGQRNAESQHRKMLAGFSGLNHIRILGLMDVTVMNDPNFPEESEERRVRTSGSEVNGMAYGIADILGKSGDLSMFDLVQPCFRGRQNEAVFALFGRAQAKGNNALLAKYLHDKFVPTFIKQLQTVNPIDSEGVPSALRRTFLELNKSMHDFLYSNRKMSQAGTSMPVPISSTSVFDVSSQSGACGIVLYVQDKTLYVANAGNSLAVISKQGAAVPLSKKHDPFDREETARIRAAEGWVSPKGFVNDEVEISRAFGFYHLLPVVNARPYVHTYQLSLLDEFVIIGNRGLWDYVSYQTAVDIARSERADPMIAAQKLRDFAISYGADGSTMIMVVSVAELFHSIVRSRQPTMDSLVDPEYASTLRRKRRDEIIDRNISRLDVEVPPPIGHVALVFTDIRNSTHLWEVNSGMATAMRLHNNLLRRQLRFCGGYEVKTEGDAFMCSFPNALSGLWWCLSVQEALLREAWPLEILECEDGKEILDVEGRIIERGLSVRMGMHCGIPVCERDPITHRMDYFGSMVNRSARICASAAGGQIMCSADVVREINVKIHGTEPETEYSYLQAPQAIEAIHQIGVHVAPVGEVKLKGLEIPETLSAVYPSALAGRKDLKGDEPSESTSRIQFSVEQMRQLELLVIRLEALSSGRVFRATPQRKGSTAGLTLSEATSPGEHIITGDPLLLLPTISEKASDSDLMLLLDSLSLRIENSLKALTLKHLSGEAGFQGILSSLQNNGRNDDRTLRILLSLFDIS